MKFYGTYIYTYIHNLRLRPTCVHIYVPPTKSFGNRYQPVFMGTWLEGLYQFYSLSLDADIVPCWSGTASEH